MNRIHSHLDEINLIGKLANLKDSHYSHSIVLSALIELLIDKGVITAHELEKKTQETDAALTPDPSHPIL
ncbi:hypothetical protein D3C73_449030 [compost metagenome]